MATMTPSPPRCATLQDLQAAMDQFVGERGWYAPDSEKPQLPAHLATSIALEASEILECFQWGGEIELERVAEELADVVLYAAQLANVLELNLAEAVSSKLAVNETRWSPNPGRQWHPRLAS
jgi:dCTP diphosphatase